MSFIKTTITAAALLCLASAAQADNRFVLVVPLISSAEATKNIAVSLSPSSLPAATVGTAYRVDLAPLLQISGDPDALPSLARYTAKSPLPAGLALVGSSIIGTPTADGATSIRVVATYKTKTGEQSYELVVGLTVVLDHAVLPDSVVGIPMAPLTFSPLLQPVPAGSRVTWSIKAGSALPLGLSINSATGIVSGTPLAPFNGDVTLMATVNGSSGEQTFQFIARQITVVQAATTLPVGILNQPYTADLAQYTTVSGDDPANNFAIHYSPVSAIPAGLSLTVAGAVTGTPTAASSTGHALTVEANYRGVTHQQTFTLPVKVPIVLNGTVRQWADGTIAATCKDYITPAPGYAYSGAVGNGTYMINPGGTPFQVSCDMTTDGGGWTVFQRRQDGSVNFYQNRNSYVNGFGSLTGEHWLGLHQMVQLTATRRELRVDMRRYTGQTGFAKYASFGVTPYPDYAVALGAFTGGVTDPLTGIAGTRFTTYDYDVDTWPDNCAVSFKGGWWYLNCHSANPNGLYLNGPHASYADGIQWGGFTGNHESLTFIEMKVR